MENIARKQMARQRVLQVDYEKMLSADPELQALAAAEAEWDQVYQEGISEVFIVGQLVRKLDEATFFVVSSLDRGNIRGYPVTKPLTRKKYSARIYLTDRLALATLDDIIDPALRRCAEKLIARIRLKDW